jgi:hypothetical protein
MAAEDSGLDFHPAQLMPAMTLNKNNKKIAQSLTFLK